MMKTSEKQTKMNRNKIIYYVCIGLFSALISIGVSQYLFNYEMVREEFTKLHFPIWLIYPMATTKILGLVAIWGVKSNTVKQWAYAGFTFNLLLAIGAHIAVNDGKFAGSLIGLILLTGSYVFYSRLKPMR